MPREFRILTPRPVDLDTIARAAGGIDPGLGVRGTANGQVIQLVAADDETVLSISASRRVDVVDDLARIAPRMPSTAFGTAPWWSEAFAPWTAGGARGGQIVEELIRITGGALERSDR